MTVVLKKSHSYDDLILLLRSCCPEEGCMERVTQAIACGDSWGLDMISVTRSSFTCWKLGFQCEEVVEP